MGHVIPLLQVSGSSCATENGLDNLQRLPHLLFDTISWYNFLVYVLATKFSVGGRKRASVLNLGPGTVIMYVPDFLH